MYLTFWHKGKYDEIVKLNDEWEKPEYKAIYYVFCGLLAINPLIGMVMFCKQISSHERNASHDKHVENFKSIFAMLLYIIFFWELKIFWI